MDLDKETLKFEDANALNGISCLKKSNYVVPFNSRLQAYCTFCNY